jgi:cyclophilin family peptidyl-prolyl cis-trans isomerase
MSVIVFPKATSPSRAVTSRSHADLAESEIEKVQKMQMIKCFLPGLCGMFLLTSLWGQSQNPTARSRPAKAPVKPDTPALAPLPTFTVEELKGLQAVLQTSLGEIVLEFFPDHAPAHVNYFAGLVKTGFYDGTTFHRVILRGIIQGGDPLSKDPSKKALYGTGGLKKLKPEFNSQPHVRGTVSAVLLPGDPDSAGSQFFICVSDQSQLNGEYTAWGQVVEGMDTVDKISAAPADSNQMAQERIEIKKALLRPIPPPTPIPFADATVEEMKNQQVRLVTSFGSIDIELVPEKAPETVRNFLKLARAGLYNDTVWHRVVTGFVIQGGDLSTRTIPLTPEQAAKYVKNLQPEFNDLKHERGVVSMARSEALDSASTSFFICLAPQPSLDGKYAAFGRVVAGLEVVDKIGAAQVFDNEKPKDRIDLLRAEVSEIKK